MSEVKSDTDEGFIYASVKWFNSEKGYGFLSLPGGGVDVFVHANQLRKSGINRMLKDGEKVRFKTDRGDKGAFAINITIVDE